MSSILFCTPCYGGMVLEPHFVSAMRLTRDLVEMGLDHDWLTVRNESLVHRGRMEMTASFLETDHTHMMWLDADIEFTTDDVGKLWNMDADIAVGVYPMKKPDACWYAAWVNGELVKDLDRFDGPVEVDYAGTGFMLIKREVIQELVKSAPTFEGKDGRTVPALYMTPIVDGCLLSEDYFFCQTAREAGFKVMMDPSVRLTHWGMYGYGDERRPAAS